MTNKSNQPDYIIRKRRSSSWYWGWVGVIVLLMLISMGIGYWLNQRQHSFSDTTKEKFAQLSTQLEDANAGIVHWQQQYNVEHQVNIELQKSLKEQQQQIRNLQKEQEAFQRIFDPNGIESGLQIASFVWEQVSVTDYSYRLMLIQARQQTKDIAGSFTITVFGDENGNAKNYDFTSIGDLTETNSNFKFRYVSNHQGNFNLPDDFKPAFIRVVATTQGRDSTSILQDFAWLNGQKHDTKTEVVQNNVGK